MKLYLLSQTVNKNWDTFDSVLVCAENEDDAKSITPYGEEFDGKDGTWVSNKEAITCLEIGEANNKQVRGVIISSFNAG